MERIWKNMDPRFLPYYKLMNETGLRACDLWTLATQDFEVIDNTMYLKIWEKKTKAFLFVPIHDEARKIVDSANAGRLFPNADEEFWRKAVLRNLQNNWSCSYCRKWNIRLHTLRHTFAMRAGAAGITKETLQQLLGHSSIKTTEVYFNQLPKEVFKDEIPLLSSTKSLTGHSLGATGVQESIYCLLMMKNNFLAGSANIQNLDERAKNYNITSYF